MNLVVTELPDELRERSQWLDEQLVGDRLGELVAELSAVNPSMSKRNLEDCLGRQRDAVLERGTTSLTVDQSRQLLRQPRLLLDLQELVFTEGGDYWSNLSRPASLRRRVQQQYPQQLVSEAPIVPLSVVRNESRSNPWIVCFATAAAVLLGVFGIQQLTKQPGQNSQVASIGWGWAKPDGLPKSTDAKSYLNELANAGDEWFKKVPDDATSLAKRINEYRQGCSMLLLAEHSPLNEEQKTWLKERCRKWAGKFDESLAKLEAGGRFEDVRNEADETAKSLVNALRGEAAKL